MSKAIEGMLYATPNSKRERYYSPAGSRYRNEYEIEINKKGHKSLHKVGEKDEWTEIQSYKDECDIGNIIAKAAAGDLNILNQRKANAALPSALVMECFVITNMVHLNTQLPSRGGLKERRCQQG